MSIGLGTQKLKQNFIGCRNLRRPLILGLDSHHKFHTGTSWYSDGILSLHKGGKPIAYTRTQKYLAKIYTIEYQEIQLHNTKIIKTKLDKSTICDQDNYLLTANSAFIHNNPNLQCHLTLINSNNIWNNSNLPLVLTNNSDHKICMPCNITVGTSETINNLNYNINEIVFAITSDTPFQNANMTEPILNDHKPQHDTNAGPHSQSNHANRINFHHNKTQNVTTNVATADHNNTSMKPLKPSTKLKQVTVQLPSPIKDPKIITSPTEVNY